MFKRIGSLAALQEALWCKIWIDLRLRVLAPGSWLRFVGPVMRRYELWRVSTGVTHALGYRWRRSTTRIEIDLTYLCNMACNDCNRSITQAPSDQHLTVQDIEKFIEQSISAKANWHQIRLLGGEPTLHPDFAHIVTLLRAYRSAHRPDCKIEVISNGYGSRVMRTLEALPEDIAVVNTAKLSNDQAVHHAFNYAPCDRVDHAKSDFANGCFVTEYSGVGLTPLGYYHCAVAGGIDRIFGKDLGQPDLPAAEDQMRPQMADLCRLCGHFTAQMEPIAPEDRVSPVWKAAYRSWSQQQPVRRNGITPKPAHMQAPPQINQ